MSTPTKDNPFREFANREPLTRRNLYLNREPVLSFQNSLLPGAIIFVSSISLAILYFSDYSEASARLAIRFTAGCSYVLLAWAFLVAPVQRLTRWSFMQTVKQSRRAIGLAMAASHSIHLAMIGVLTNIAWLDDWSPLGTAQELLPSFSLYIVIFAMALTSNDYSQKLLGRTWRILHLIGIYILMFAFTGSYLAKAAEHGGYYWAFAILGVTAFSLRFLGRRRKSDNPAVR